MFILANQERSDQEPLLLGNGRKTFPKYRVGMFMLTFLFVGAIGSVLLFKQHAPITDAAVGNAPGVSKTPFVDFPPAKETVADLWDFKEYKCPVTVIATAAEGTPEHAAAQKLMTDYSTGADCVCTDKYEMPAEGKGKCTYVAAQSGKKACYPLPGWKANKPDTPSADRQKEKEVIDAFRHFFACYEDNFKIKKWILDGKNCDSDYYYGMDHGLVYARFVRDFWDGGARSSYKRMKFTLQRVMCPADKPICKTNEDKTVIGDDGKPKHPKECFATTDYTGAGLSIDLGSGGTRPLLLLYGGDLTNIKTKQWKWIKGAYYACQLNVGNKDTDLCQGEITDYYKRTKTMMRNSFETLIEINKHRGDNPFQINFIFGGVTAGGRNQEKTVQGGELIPKLAELKKYLKEFLAPGFEFSNLPSGTAGEPVHKLASDSLDTIIRMITGQEEAYYGWIDANKAKIMELARNPGPLVPVSKADMKTLKNTFERGGASAQWTLTVNSDVNTYEDVYKFNLYGQDYYVWADSLVSGGQNMIWENFMKSVPLQEIGGVQKRPFSDTSDLVTDNTLEGFLKSVENFFSAQKGLCGDVGLEDNPCFQKKKYRVEEQIQADTEGASCDTSTASSAMHLGERDQMLVQMEQRWTGLCVAGVKIPQTGIAQLDETVVAGPGKEQKLIWTGVTQKFFENLLPRFSAPGGADPVWPKTEDECEWWKLAPVGIALFDEKTQKFEQSDMTTPTNVLKDYLSLSNPAVNAALLIPFQTLYNTCFKGKNKNLMIALFYTRLFKKIEDGIKEFKYGQEDDLKQPFQHAEFEYKNEKSEAEWTEGASWMQVYNSKVRSLFTTTAAAAESVASGLEETIGSNNFQPVELPGTIIDLDSFEH